jgi:hypothetical protein
VVFDAPEPMLMMRPEPRRRMLGSAAVVVHHAVVRFSTNVCSNASSLPTNGSGLPPSEPPTLLTSTSTRPKRSIASNTGRRASSRSVASATTASPRSSATPATSSVAASSPEVRDDTTIVAPSAA